MNTPLLQPAYRLSLRADASVQPTDGRPVLLEPRAAALLCLAALEPGISRLRAATMLWPDSTDPRRNLRQQLLRFKQQFGRALTDGEHTLVLAGDVSVELPGDGALLAGQAYEECGAFADWLERQRASRRAGQADALRQQIVQGEVEGDLESALRAAEALAGADPASEYAQRELMRIHYLRDDAPAGLAVYRRLTQQLASEHGTAPAPATERLARALRDAAPVQPVSGPRRLPPTLLRPPRLIGRQDELRQASQAQASGQAVLLLAEAGMGKSRLMAELLRGAAPGTAVSVSARPGDAAVPYATLARLLRQVLERRNSPGLPLPQPTRLDTHVLSRLLPELRLEATAQAAAPPLPPDGSRLVLQASVQASVQALLAEAGLRQAAVDDLHFADEASIELLHALVDDEPLQHMGWLLAMRPAEGAAAAQALRDRLLEARRLRCIVLAPLTPAETAELLCSLNLPGLDADAWAPRLHRHTGGNPLFLLETLKQMQLADVAAVRLPASATVGVLIERRLKALSPDALALARLAAVAGPDFGPALAEAVTGQPALAMADAWAELEAAQVLRDRAFAHDLVWEAAHRGIPQPIAEHLHAAVARHLQAHGGEPARLAAHWLAARDDAAALPQLLRAADLSRDAMRRREEIEFIEQAAEIAARCSLAGLPSAHALHLRAYLTREIVDGVAPALPTLERALQHAQTEAERANVLALRLCARTKLYELDSAIEDGQAALALALRVGDDKVVADVMSSLATALSMLDRHDEAAALMARHWPAVERLSDPESSLFTERGLVCDNAGRPHEGREFHRRAIDIGRRRGEHSEAMVASQNLAASCIDTGELDTAAQMLQQAEALRLAHDDLHSAQAMGWNLLAIVWRDRGRYDQALTASKHALADASDRLPARLPLDRQHRAWTWFWLGQWARALQDLSDGDSYPELPAWVAARGLQLRARIAAARGLPAGETLARALARLEPGMLRTMRGSIALDGALAHADAATALVNARAIRDAAEADGFHGLRWAAEWACARLALAAGAHELARGFCTACMDRPAAHTPLDQALGAWWHGLWQVMLRLGDSGGADAARAEGVAWIHRTLQRELAPEFHASFRQAVPAHRALLAGFPPLLGG